MAKLTTAKFCWNSYISWSRLVFDNKGRKLLNISFNFQLFALMIKDVSQMNARFWEDFELILFANILNDKFSEREWFCLHNFSSQQTICFKCWLNFKSNCKRDASLKLWNSYIKLTRISCQSFYQRITSVSTEGK